MSARRTPLTFLAACAIESDYVYLAAQPDPLEGDSRLSRMCLFDAQLPGDNKWRYHDLPDWRVRSVCVWPASPAHPRRLCALSETGDIEFDFVGGRSSERIPDAGLPGPGGAGYGYLKAIRFIAGSLYACGDSGQVYRRVSDQWVHIDDGLLASSSSLQAQVNLARAGQPEKLERALQDQRTLSDIDGFSSNDLYVVGDSGRIFHYDGVRWTRLATSYDESLTAVRCLSGGEVLICGANGVVLKGNRVTGFVSLTGVDDNDTLTSIASLGGVTYVASERGLWRLGANGMQRVGTGLTPELLDANRLDVVGSVLWSFGYKDIAYFDGSSWTRVQHPDNPRI